MTEKCRRHSKSPQRNVTVAGLVYKIRGEKGLLSLYRCVLIESNQGEHFAGFFAGLCVDKEVLHEDFWGGGVRGAIQTAVCLIEQSELLIVAFDGFRRKTTRASSAFIYTTKPGTVYQAYIS